MYRSNKTTREKHSATLSYMAAPKKVCGLCLDKVQYLDYKDLKRLNKYLSRYMKIQPRRRTGLCAKHQRMVAQALKRARHMALLPFVLR